MSDPAHLIIPYCTKAWAEKFFTDYQFNSYWSDASDTKKNSALCTASDFFDQYVEFTETYKRSDEFTEDDPNDYENEINPKTLKQACAQEAAYLLSLDDNPAEPMPVTILGVSKYDATVVETANVPPIFPIQVIKLLESLGAEIDSEAKGVSKIQFFERHTT